MKIVLLFVVVFVAAASAQLFQGAPASDFQRSFVVTQQIPAQAPTTYVLPAGADLIVGQIRSTFSCNNRIYGYYADTDNNCQIFHVCVPFVDEQNNQAPVIYSFICGNQTVFDQANLVCANPSDAVPCSEAPQLYSVNENFGKTDRPIVRA